MGPGSGCWESFCCCWSSIASIRSGSLPPSQAAIYHLTQMNCFYSAAAGGKRFPLSNLEFLLSSSWLPLSSLEFPSSIASIRSGNPSYLSPHQWIASRLLLVVRVFPWPNWLLKLTVIEWALGRKFPLVKTLARMHSWMILPKFWNKKVFSSRWGISPNNKTQHQQFQHRKEEIHRC